MKKQILIGMLPLLPMVGSFAAGETYYATDYLLSAPEAGEAGTTAIHMSSNAIVAWADGYTNMQYGTDVDATWMTPEKALGPAEGTSSEIVSLGRGGTVTLTFPAGIGNRPGTDFAVFENSFSDTFLELAFVEVSSDGIHFVRFPNYSNTPDPVGAYGDLWTRWIHNLAGKYRQGYGTPFDLEELRTAYNAQLAGDTDFSAAFAQQLTNNFPLLDLNNVTHLRLVDIVGDGSVLDSRGSVIYDPYATTGSAGFDLDAVGVLNEAFVPYADWAASHPPGNLQEYALTGVPILGRSESNGFVALGYCANRWASVAISVEVSLDLESWSNAVPESIEQQAAPDFIQTKLLFPADALNRFYRLIFEVQ